MIDIIVSDGAGWRLEIHDSLSSTSDVCIARAEAGEADGLAVLARRQTQARGSRGRSWIEPPAGNLAVSVLLRPEGALEQPALWPLVAGLALHQALSHDQGSDTALTLKWPNDVLLGARKLAGILVERGTGGGRDWLVIGFGANLSAAPRLADREAACLAELGPPPPPEQVAPRLLAALASWRLVWLQGGLAAIRTAWLARAQPLETSISAMVRGLRLTGSFAGLASDGALLLRIDERLERVDAGEILLPEGC